MGIRQVVNWVIALGPVLLVAVWLALLYTISRGGWRRFAARYSTPRRLPSNRFVADEVRFGSVLSPYRRVVRVALSNEGLYLATVPLFRVFHRPLLIPWDCVKSVKRRYGTGNSRYRIEIEDSAGRILLRLPGTIDAQIRMVRPAPSNLSHAGSMPFAPFAAAAG
jgi:hypothetical protein